MKRGAFYRAAVLADADYYWLPPLSYEQIWFYAQTFKEQFLGDDSNAQIIALLLAQLLWDEREGGN